MMEAIAVGPSGKSPISDRKDADVQTLVSFGDPTTIQRLTVGRSNSLSPSAEAATTMIVSQRVL
jgi:hypothetical protein